MAKYRVLAPGGLFWLDKEAACGEVRDDLLPASIPNLLRVGWIEEVKDEDVPEPTPAPEPQEVVSTDGE